MKKPLLLMIMSIVGLLPAMGGTNYLEIPDLEIAPGETKTLVINLVNDASFTAFQMNLHLPEGITINEDEYGDADVSIVGSRIADHSIISNYIDANTLSIAAYSGKLRPFKGNSGAFLEITITANSSFTHNEDINVTNIIFTTTSAEEYKFEDVSGLLVCLVQAQSVTLSDSNLSLTIGESAQLTATVLPENATDKTVTWSTSDAEVASVDVNGKVTAVAVGTATITATCGSVSATCEVSVKNDSGVENVSDDSFGIRVEEGEIVIEGLADDELVQVFTLDGKLIYSGYERRISLQDGSAYIVVYPGGARKILL